MQDSNHIINEVTSGDYTKQVVFSTPKRDKIISLRTAVHDVQPSDRTSYVPSFSGHE